MPLEGFWRPRGPDGIFERNKVSFRLGEKAWVITFLAGLIRPTGDERALWPG